MVWLPAPQARSRTRMPALMPAISMSVSVTDDRPAENSRSHFAQPGAAFSQVLRSSDFAEEAAVLETRFSEVISFPADVRRSYVCLLPLDTQDKSSVTARTSTLTVPNCRNVRFGSKADICSAKRHVR